MKLSTRNCSLEGNVSSLAAAVNLTYLDLSINKLGGNFASNFSSLLNTIDLSQNNFIGEISDTVGNLSELEALQLSFNDFSGSIPEALCTAPSKTNLSRPLKIHL